MRDPYLYPDVDVLINKDGIKDQEQLDKLEEEIVPVRMIALRKQGMTISSVFDIQKIHGFLFETFKGINWDSLNHDEKIKRVASIVQELWQIHCFREGNTRTVALFLYFLLKTLNIHINPEFLGKNAKYFRNSLVVASLYSMSKPEFLLGIIKDSTTVKNPSSGKYETINGYEVNKYSYQNHTIEKIKTIKELKDLK